MISDKEYIERVGGAIAYSGYCDSTGGVSLISGDKLPDFESLKPEIQKAWISAATAVMAYSRGLYNVVGAK